MHSGKSKKVLLRIILVANLSGLINASSDPNVYKNRTTPKHFEEKSEYISVDLIDHFTRSQTNEQRHGNYIHSEEVNEIDNAVIKKHERKLMENTKLFEGDIRGNIKSINDLRNAIIDPNLRWPKAIIPYVISTDFNADERNVIGQAMLEYHKKTCIRFVPRSNEADYIVVRTTGTGCNSNVGRTGGPQTVSLDNGCVHVGIVIHELMHATGFYHEQSRTDRDDYVIINWDNIQEANIRNFDKLSLNEIQYLGVAYDTGSVMHYDKFAFAKDTNVPTIIAKDGSHLGNTKGFSKNDLIKLNRLYQCDFIPPPTVMPTSSTSTTTASPVTVNPTTDPTVCNDAGQDCSVFRDQGFCVKTADLMKVFCRKTCGFCPPVPVDPSCIDQDYRCEFWAGRGECNSNPNYMLVQCKKSCQACTS